MGRIIAFCNHKGGVGKTTSVANIGAVLASKGYRTLLVDLDAQANLTTSFLEQEPENSIYSALKGNSAIPVVHVRERLDIVPSSMDLAGIELEISGTPGREYLLRGLLKEIAGQYDYILIDNAPSLGLLTINSFTAAQEIVIPLTAEALPLKGLVKLEEFIQLVKTRLNPALHISGVMITRYSARKKLYQLVADSVKQRYGALVFHTMIRENIALAEAPLSGQDVTLYAPKSNGAKDYALLTDELIGRGQADARADN